MASAIADHLGHHRLSIKHLLAKSRALPKDVIPKRKKGSDCLAMIKIQVLKILERYVKKSVLVDPHHQVPIGGLPYSAIH